MSYEEYVEWNDLANSSHWTSMNNFRGKSITTDNQKFSHSFPRLRDCVRLEIYRRRRTSRPFIFWHIPSRLNERWLYCRTINFHILRWHRRSRTHQANAQGMNKIKYWFKSIIYYLYSLTNVQKKRFGFNRYDDTQCSRHVHVLHGIINLLRNNDRMKWKISMKWTDDALSLN